MGLTVIAVHIILKVFSKEKKRKKKKYTWGSRRAPIVVYPPFRSLRLLPLLPLSASWLNFKKVSY